ncbi:coiled-coil domain-containing protein 190 isoform X2 [Danio rerio]|uniref:Coiled-coil domain-containing protein 190 isoform X2 n=1 Tax=Danio rerio TaxID=7955 RepID=A0AC58I5C8_DANRE
MRRGDWSSRPAEAQRREERRTEFRLAEGLQRLDQAKHYHLNTLTREQRRLSRDLASIKTGNSWKRGFHSLGLRASNHDAGRPAAYYKRTLLPIIPLVGKEADDHKAFYSSHLHLEESPLPPLLLPFSDRAAQWPRW